MRTDPRYNRVRAMITHDAVPRLANGGIALCHLCQRTVHFAGGFLELLTKVLERAARDTRPRGVCPNCGSSKLYFISRYERTRRADCRHERSPRTDTARKSQKKSARWYEEVTELYRSGVNAYAISKKMGMADSKSVYAFIARLEALDHISGRILPRMANK